jgi:DNA repair protein RadC
MTTLPMAVYEELKSKYNTGDIISVTHPADVLRIKKVALLSKKQAEHFISISLDGAGNVLKCNTITTGLINHSLVHPREVFRTAIKDNAVSIVVLHNHPSGALTPSNQDLSVTEQLVKAGEIIGISVLDHIIVSKNGITSFREHGYM